MALDLPWWSVPRCWPGECVAVLGGGQSLTQGQVDLCEGRCRVVAINRAYARAPWADWLWGCDPGRFWVYHSGPTALPGWPDATGFEGEKVVLWSPDLPGTHLEQLPRLSAAGVRVLRHRGEGYHKGVSDDPGWVHGNNSCFQVLSIIAHTGARRVLLLGVDMRGRHWHDGYPGIAHPKYAEAVAPNFRTLAAPLAERGVEVLNCSPGSALDAFPVADLEDCLR